MKRIYSALDLAAVYHARNVLDAAGIRAVVKNEFLASALGELPLAECWRELWVVQDSDAERAEALLREAFSAKNGPPWTCENCGETLDAQFTQCWSCGTHRVFAAQCRHT